MTTTKPPFPPSAASVDDPRPPDTVTLPPEPPSASAVASPAEISKEPAEEPFLEEPDLTETVAPTSSLLDPASNEMSPALPLVLSPENMSTPPVFPIMFPPEASSTDPVSMLAITESSIDPVLTLMEPLSPPSASLLPVTISTSPPDPSMFAPDSRNRCPP